MDSEKTMNEGLGSRVVPLVFEDGTSENLVIDQGLAETIAKLPAHPRCCFIESRDEIWVSLSNLRNTRVRPAGVKNAATYMLAASRGEMEARQPILVRALGFGLYAVVDGNSTVVVAHAAKWTSIPAMID